MKAEEFIAKQLATNPHVFPCGHVDTGEAGCGGCADERLAETQANERVVAAYEALCPAPKPLPKNYGSEQQLNRLFGRLLGLFWRIRNVR